MSSLYSTHCSASPTSSDVQFPYKSAQFPVWSAPWCASSSFTVLVERCCGLPTFLGNPRCTPVLGLGPTHSTFPHRSTGPTAASTSSPSSDVPDAFCLDRPIEIVKCLKCLPPLPQSSRRHLLSCPGLRFTRRLLILWKITYLVYVLFIVCNPVKM